MLMKSKTRTVKKGKARAEPGTSGHGKYFRIVVRPKEEFVTFRYNDIGKKGHLQRLAGKRESGTWATQAYLVSKKDAKKTDHKLIPTTEDARKLFIRLGSRPRLVKADIYRAKDRNLIPAEDKPTEAQRRAQMENIKKAYEARWQHH